MRQAEGERPEPERLQRWEAVFRRERRPESLDRKFLKIPERESFSEKRRCNAVGFSERSKECSNEKK